MAGYAVLMMFFCLSGFLIAGSATRLRLRDFLINRGLRIIPALAVEILLCAFILGATFTTLPLREYFSNLQTWHYLTNIVGWINYQLPGVFKDHPVTLVNFSLWTVPHEIGCYLIMSTLIYFGLLKRAGLIVAAGFAIGFIGLGLSLAGLQPVEHGHGIVRDLLAKGFIFHWSRLYVGFLLGIGLYLYRDRIPYSHGLAAFATAVVVIIGFVGPAPWLSTPVLNLLVGPAVAYLTAYIGVSALPKLPLFDRGDYSYGIYLYGWPAQQTLVALLPDVQNLWLHFILTVPIVMVFAVTSWHLIERRILQLRKKFSFVAKQRREEGRGLGPPFPYPAPM